MGQTKTKVVAEEIRNKEKYEEIFDIVTDGSLYYIGLTGKLISKKTFQKAEEAKKYIDNKPWDLIINAACICMDLSNKQSK